MDRILGIDYGEKRIGLAVSDPFGWTAQPLVTITYKNGRQAFEEVCRYIETYEVKTLVFGLPLQLNGEEGIQVTKVRKFADQFHQFLRQRLPEAQIATEFMDERLSTAGAERVLIDADLSRARRKEVIDKQAASFMLQGYLDLKSRRHS